MDTIVTPNLKPAVDELLLESHDDLVGLWEVVSELEELTGAEGDVLRAQVMEAVRDLLAHGLEAGDPPFMPGGYRPWPDQRAEAVLARIDAEWTALGHAPSIPDIVWFSRVG